MVCARIASRRSGPWQQTEGRISCLPLPRPFGIYLEGADGSTNAKAGRIYSDAEKVDTPDPTGRLLDSVSSMDSSIALLFLLGLMMPPVSSRSRRFLSSTSASVLLWRSRASSCVSSPMANYPSCLRAHGPQKATPRISTSARRGQGSSALMPTWQGSGFVIASGKRTPCTKPSRPPL